MNTLSINYCFYNDYEIVLTCVMDQAYITHNNINLENVILFNEEENLIGYNNKYFASNTEKHIIGLSVNGTELIDNNQLTDVKIIYGRHTNNSVLIKKQIVKLHLTLPNSDFTSSELCLINDQYVTYKQKKIYFHKCEVLHSYIDCINEQQFSLSKDYVICDANQTPMNLLCCPDKNNIMCKNLIQMFLNREHNTKLPLYWSVITPQGSLLAEQISKLSMAYIPIQSFPEEMYALTIDNVLQALDKTPTGYVIISLDDNSLFQSFDDLLDKFINNGTQTILTTCNKHETDDTTRKHIYPYFYIGETLQLKKIFKKAQDVISSGVTDIDAIWEKVYKMTSWQRYLMSIVDDNNIIAHINEHTSFLKGDDGTKIILYNNV